MNWSPIGLMSRDGNTIVTPKSLDTIVITVCFTCHIIDRRLCFSTRMLNQDDVHIQCAELFESPVHLLFCAKAGESAELPFRHPKVHWTVCLGAIEGLSAAQRLHPEAILLKIDEDALWAEQLCWSLVDALGRNTPLILAWAANGAANVRMLVQAGAVDLIEGPFRRSEVTRLWAHVRRRHSISHQGRFLRFGDLSLDLDALKVRRAGRNIHLPTLQRRLLQIMLEQPQHVFSREELQQKLWQGKPVEEANLRTCIRRLRKALNAPGEQELISNIPQTGYTLDGRSA
jgi:two-component system, OmpR family, phosphate regulon response regulator PhoB